MRLSSTAATLWADDVSLACAGSVAPLRVVKYYYLNGQRVAMRNNGTLYYLLTDHLGSTAITADGTTGATVAEMRYKAYGDTRYSSGTTPTTYKFTGQRLDDSTGLYYYGARYYDPALGRFISADTLVPSPGNPQAFNRYSYVLNNPLKYTDPTGHSIPVYERGDRNVYYHPQTGTYSYDVSPQVRWGGLDGTISVPEAILGDRTWDTGPQPRGSCTSYSAYAGMGRGFVGGSFDLVSVEADEGPQFGIYVTKYGSGWVIPGAAATKGKGALFFDSQVDGEKVPVNIVAYEGRFTHGNAGAVLFGTDIAQGWTDQGERSGLNVVELTAGPSFSPLVVSGGYYNTYSEPLRINGIPMVFRASNSRPLEAGLLRMAAVLLSW